MGIAGLLFIVEPKFLLFVLIDAVVGCVIVLTVEFLLSFLH